MKTKDYGLPHLPNKVHGSEENILLFEQALEAYRNNMKKEELMAAALFVEQGLVRLELLERFCDDSYGKIDISKRGSAVWLDETFDKYPHHSIPLILKRDAKTWVKAFANALMLSGATSRRIGLFENADVIGVRMIAVGDGRSSELCHKEHGKIYELNEIPSMPHYHWCRCTASPLLEFIKEDELVMAEYRASKIKRQ